MRLFNPLGLAHPRRHLVYIVVSVAFMAFWTRQSAEADAVQPPLPASEAPLQLTASTTLSLPTLQRQPVAAQAPAAAPESAHGAAQPVWAAVMSVSLSVVERMKDWLSEEPDSSGNGLDRPAAYARRLAPTKT